MNETRRKPTTGRQSPSLFDMWHGIFYMPSRIDIVFIFLYIRIFNDPLNLRYLASTRWANNRYLLHVHDTSTTTCGTKLSRLLLGQVRGGGENELPTVSAGPVHRDLSRHIGHVSHKDSLISFLMQPCVNQKKLMVHLSAFLYRQFCHEQIVIKGNN